VDCVFLGYAHHSIAYRFLVIKLEEPDIYGNTFLESRGVTFFKNIFSMKDLHSMSRLTTNVIAGITLEPYEKFEHVEDTLEPVHEKIDSDVPRRSKRQRIVKSFGDDFTIYLMNDTPKIILEVFASPDADDMKVVHSEMDSIISNETWELVDQPYDCKPVGYKWVLQKKLRPNNTIDKYKASLVAKSYT
jgi:hypothetical protein